MTISKRDIQRLRYIANSIRHVEDYTVHGREQLLNDAMAQDAVLRRLETLADASNKLPDALKQRHPEIDWRDAYGFRNVAAHAYEFIDLIRIWEIIENYLPALKAAVEAELRQADATREGEGPAAT